MDRLNRKSIFMKNIGSLLEFSFRLYVWLKISIYGLGKIVGGQFHRKDALPEHIATTPLSEIGSFDLAWAFFGYANGYIWFIGLSQLAGGLLLLFNKTKLMGVALLLPILLNIIVVDIFFKISAGALLSACIYLVMCLFIVYHNRLTVIAAFRELIHFAPIKRDKKERLLFYGIVFVIFALIFFTENIVIHKVGR